MAEKNELPLANLQKLHAAIKSNPDYVASAKWLEVFIEHGTSDKAVSMNAFFPGNMSHNFSNACLLVLINQIIQGRGGLPGGNPVRLSVHDIDAVGGWLLSLKPVTAHGVPTHVDLCLQKPH